MLCIDAVLCLDPAKLVLYYNQNLNQAESICTVYINQVCFTNCALLLNLCSLLAPGEILK